MNSFLQCEIPSDCNIVNEFLRICFTAKKIVKGGLIPIGFS
jgi:hypothetical protein